MHPVLRKILVVLGGIVVGSMVNMGTLKLLTILVPAPAGVNPEDFESIRANLHLYEFKHLIVPVIAHALGTLVGAFFVAKLMLNKKLIWALVMGGWFFVGGITAASLLPGGPAWFYYTDLGLAYFPMAYLGALAAGARGWK